MKKNRKSFIKSCVLYLSIYSIVLFLTFIFTNSLIEKSINNIYFNIDNLIKYKDFLEADEFNKISLKKYPRNEIVIYDEDNKIIYETHNYRKEYLPLEQLSFVDDFSENTYFLVRTIKANNDVQYFISKNYVDDKNDEIVIDYAIIDSDYNIISGNLFNDRKKLKQSEFLLLKNGVNDKNYISKYTYKNVDGDKRTIVFYQKDLSTKEYIKLTNKIKSDWLFMIPMVLLETIIVIFLFYTKIKSSINVLNKKIIDVDDNNDSTIPIEFEDFYKKMSDLLKSLDNEKKKRIMEEGKRQSIITNLSHDIKTPLTVIQGYAKAFDDGIVPPDRVKKYMNAIYDKSVLATEIINSLFQYSQMEHFEFKPSYNKADFSEFCKEYLALKYTELEMQKYRLDFRLEEKAEIYNFDSILITRLFDNIINNCVKHNKNGTTIFFRYELDEKNIIIIIADNGKGISVNNIDTLFEPFVVGNEARTSGTGTGLGLYIAKRIVDLHDGEIKIIEKPKKPYKFEIVIKFKKM